MPVRLVQFAAIVLTAVVLVPGGAHLFALPNKIALSQEAYLAVQGIYRGWSLLGAVIIAALAANAVNAVMVRRRRTAFVWALAATILIAANLAVFFAVTYPANVATANWTQLPQGWEALRLRWEYSHAINAVIMFAAFCAVTASALTAKPGDRQTA